MLIPLAWHSDTACEILRELQLIEELQPDHGRLLSEDSEWTIWRVDGVYELRHPSGEREIAVTAAGAVCWWDQNTR